MTFAHRKEKYKKLKYKKLKLVSYLDLKSPIQTITEKCSRQS